MEYFSKEGFIDIIHPYAYSKESIYFMLHRKYITIEEYKNSTQKDEYEYLYKKDDELKKLILQMKAKALLNIMMILQSVKLFMTEIEHKESICLRF